MNPSRAMLSWCLVLLLALTGACRRPEESSCAPGEQVACVGPSGCQGHQACGSTGPCACPQAPVSVTYQVPVVACIQGVECAIEPPLVVGGAATHFAVEPKLPTGLVFDERTGAVLGKALNLSPRALYTVTASNNVGSASTALWVAVVTPPPGAPRYAPPRLGCRLGQACRLEAPQVSGGPVVGFTVEPALPEGLSLDPLHGDISGVPTKLTAASTWVVRAWNSEGAGEASVEIAVGSAVLEVSPAAVLDLGRIAFFAGSPGPGVTRRLSLRNDGPSVPGAKGLDAVHLSETPWTVTPLSGVASEDELCVGRFDEVSGLCEGTLPSSGPGAYNPVVGLYPGWRLEVPVRLRPRASGLHRWLLAVHSDDAVTPTHTIEVRADVGDYPPCNFRVSAAALDFGGVAQGHPKTLSVDVVNQGAQECLVNNLGLDQGNGGTFGLVSGADSDRLLQPGETWTFKVMARSSLPPGSLPVPRSGALVLMLSSPTSPLVQVPLSMVELPSCGELAPHEVDFGTVQAGCGGGARQVLFVESCAPGFMSRQSVVAPTAPFSVSALPAGAPGFQVDYHPVTAGQHQDEVRVRYLQGGIPVDYVLSLRGAANATGLAEEAWTLPPNAVDVLTVIDDSCSMSDKQAALAAALPRLLGRALREGADFQWAVMRGQSAWANDPNYTYFLQRTSAGNAVLTPGTPDLEAQFRELVNVGSSGTSAQTCMDPVRAGLWLSDAAPFQTGPVWRRDHARLAISCISDQLYTGQPVAWLVAQLQGLKPTTGPRAVTFSAVGPFGQQTATCTYGAPGYVQEFTTLVSELGGAKVDICTPDWAQGISDLGDVTFAVPRDIALAGRPAQAPSGLEVRINGGVIPAQSALTGSPLWEWDSVTNHLRFTKDQPLHPGERVSVRYQAACVP